MELEPNLGVKQAFALATPKYVPICFICDSLSRNHMVWLQDTYFPLTIT
jgi:hypothetical protein